jgi:hypothetical protein
MLDLSGVGVTFGYLDIIPLAFTMPRFLESRMKEEQKATFVLFHNLLA